MGADLRSRKIPRSRSAEGWESSCWTIFGQCPPAADYLIQYSFNNGEKVDAAIRLPGGPVPVGCQFP